MLNRIKEIALTNTASDTYEQQERKQNAADSISVGVVASTEYESKPETNCPGLAAPPEPSPTFTNSWGRSELANPEMEDAYVVVYSNHDVCRFPSCMGDSLTVSGYQACCDLSEQMEPRGLS